MSYQTFRTQEAAVLEIAELDLLERGAEAAAVQSAALGPVSPDRVAVYARHTTHPAFRAFGAFDGRELVGFAYGATCRPGQWWYDQIRAPLMAAGHANWVADPYAVTELHVLPACQGHGVGLELVSRLLSGVDQRSALLSTYDTDGRARRLYRGLGFADLLTGFRFGASVQGYALMAAPLPLPIRTGLRQSRTGRPATPTLDRNAR